jgi:adenylate cyclase
LSNARLRSPCAVSRDSIGLASRRNGNETRIPIVETPSTKLAVILHADVVGSTHLVQRDERIAHERIHDAFRRFSETIARYGGATHEIRGDALVAEFARASDAVCAALAFQVENGGRNAALDDEIRPEIRIGISLGEVIVADGSVTGAGVIVAQRLEQLAEPGGIVVQGSVSETVPSRLPLEFDSLGERTLKGFDQPVRAFAVQLTLGEDIPPPDAASSGMRVTGAVANTAEEGPQLDFPDKQSIAVLPLKSLSTDPELGYFSEGLTEDLITILSYIRHLMVISHTSTSKYEGKKVDVRQIGKELGVRYVLEGSVRKTGDSVRITAQLIDAATGDHVWANNWDYPIKEIFTQQDEITKKILEALEIKLVYGDEARRIAQTTDNLKAYGLYHQGRGQAALFTKEGTFRAKLLFEQAIQEDPTFIRAFVSMGWMYAIESLYRFSGNPDQSRDQGTAWAQKALAMDESFADTYTLMAYLHSAKGDADRSVALIEKALSLDPNSSQNLAVAGLIYNDAGMAKEGLAATKEAFRLSPFPNSWFYRALAGSYNHLARYEEAIPPAREGVRRLSRNIAYRFHLTIALAGAGKMDEALLHAKEMLSIEPDSSFMKSYLQKQGSPEVKARLEALLRKVGLLE